MDRQLLRANSRLRQHLGHAGVEFLTHAAGAIVERILPHVEVTAWQEQGWAAPRAVWTSPQRTEIRITLAIREKTNPNRRSLTARVWRRQTPARAGPRDKLWICESRTSAIESHCAYPRSWSESPLARAPLPSMLSAMASMNTS